MTNREAAIKIIKEFCKAGFEALLAGGCVRDMLIKRPAKDYDIATDATPQQITKLFRRTLNVGAKFGVIIVLLDDNQVEVATFRTETGYSDGRHPDSVTFSNAKQDALRRDFTINGMFYDPVTKEIIDYVGGRDDIDKRTIRTIGLPHQRFGEDYLRMLRAIRFAAQLDYKIAPATFAAIKKYANKITCISTERIAIELEAIFVSRNRVSGIKNFLKSGLLSAVFDKFDTSKVKQAIKVMDSLPANIDFALAFAAFFSSSKTQFAIDRAKHLKLSNSRVKHIRFLLENRSFLLKKDMTLAELKLILAQPYFEDLFALQKAINKADNLPTSPLVALRRRINALGDIELKPAPLLNGHELIRHGAVPGPALGHLAKEMYIAQLEGLLKNKDQAIEWVKKTLPKYKDFC